MMKWLRSEPAITLAEEEANPRLDLQPVLDSVDAAVLALDAQRRRLYANPAAERLFGLVLRPPAAPGAATRVPELQRLPQLLQWIEAVAATGRPREGRLQLPGGRQLEVHVTPLAGAQGGCVVAARDVTEMARLETARRDFIAGVSHELRTPLTSIQGYAELLRQDPALPEPTRAEFLDCILDNTARLSRLARDLVTLSAVETGTYPFHFDLIEAASLLAPAIAALAPLAAAHNCDLVLAAAGPGRVRADAEACGRVLLNLVENAILHGAAAAGERGERLRVTVSGAAEAGQYCFRVRDNGAGIGVADQHRIFERFYRVDRGRGAGSGTGLGLALVKHIVHEHGGLVSVASTLGQGSTFTVALPLVAPAESGSVPAPQGASR